MIPCAPTPQSGTAGGYNVSLNDGIGKCIGDELVGLKALVLPANDTHRTCVAALLKSRLGRQLKHLLIVRFCCVKDVRKPAYHQANG